jgi:hypothetical protein
MLDELSRLHDGRSRRVSSWNTTGHNTDGWTIGADATKTLPTSPGPA